MSYKDRVKITDRSITTKYKDCFVLHVKGYHGDADYNANEDYKFDFNEDTEDEDWEYLVKSYLGYKAMKDLKPRYGGEADIDQVHEAMDLKEDEDGKIFFDWPINIRDPNYGCLSLTVQDVSVAYYNQNGKPFKVEIS